MADGNQRAAWAHSVAMAVSFGRVMSGKGPTIFDCIPARYREQPKPKAAADEAAESAHAFALLESTLRTMHRQGKA